MSCVSLQMHSRSDDVLLRVTDTRAKMHASVHGCSTLHKHTQARSKSGFPFGRKRFFYHYPFIPTDFLIYSRIKPHVIVSFLYLKSLLVNIARKVVRTYVVEMVAQKQCRDVTLMIGVKTYI